VVVDEALEADDVTPDAVVDVVVVDPVVVEVVLALVLWAGSSPAVSTDSAVLDPGVGPPAPDPAYRPCPSELTTTASIPPTRWRPCSRCSVAA